jgi:uncharacterized membrane-anchored protein
MKISLLVLFILMCFAQWIIPAKMIYESEHVITDGDEYKFKTAPIDPSDPIRGKYIILNFESNLMTFNDSVDWMSGDEVFVTFTTDSAGFAIPETISRTSPETATFLKTTVDYVNSFGGEYKVYFNLPFTRFYLEESKASQAEQAYWQAQRDSAQVAYALVSVGAGQAVLKNVYINDIPIVEVVNNFNKNEK